MHADLPWRENWLSRRPKPVPCPRVPSEQRHQFHAAWRPYGQDGVLYALAHAIMPGLGRATGKLALI